MASPIQWTSLNKLQVTGKPGVLQPILNTDDRLEASRTSHLHLSGAAHPSEWTPEGGVHRAALHLLSQLGKLRLDSSTKKYRLFRSGQWLSRVWLSATPWIAARQASLSITNSQSSITLTSMESVMPSNHLILCRLLLLLPPIPPSIRVFSNESPLRMRLFSSVQSLSRVRLFATPWITACQASLSITNSRSSLRLTSIVTVMPSSHLILSRPLLLLPPIPPSIRVFFQWVNSSHEVAKVLEFQL